MEDTTIGLLAIAVFLLATLSAGHALLFKRDTRAVIAWVGLIVLVPLAGAILYWTLGVNRVRKTAIALRPEGTAPGAGRETMTIAASPSHLAGLARVGDRVGPFPLSAGNGVEVLENGDEAFPPMLAAIAAAEKSVALATYIFDSDPVGERFAEALVAAQKRGVEVRVLIDAFGQRYSLRSMLRRLKRAGVSAAAFMPILRPGNMFSLNLRNHRKLLIVDGWDAFTGGMNIRAGNVLAVRSRHPIRDLQFRVHGPVVRQLMATFASDWAFTTRETLDGETWFPQPQDVGAVTARAIPDGPDEYFEVTKMIILAAIGEARQRVAIATPYFLPDASLISALNTAALRGIAVEIVLPAGNNLKIVQWASHTLYWQLLERGCRIWHSPPPFDHSKLMLVDNAWLMVGSTNWDARSLRLNFELNLECYDEPLAARMNDWFERRREASREVSQAEMDSRSLPVRLRDSLARLLSPYL